jgi:hypothetical protein
MHIGWVGAGVVLTVGIVVGSARAAIDSTAGEGASDAATKYGVSQAAQTWGAIFQAPAEIVQEVRPAISSMAGQASGIVGGAANGQAPPPTTGAEGYGTPGAGQAQP